MRPESARAWEDNEYIRHALREAGVRSLADLPRGMVLAVVQLVEVVPTEMALVSDRERAFGNYSPGRYAWRLDDVRALDVPVLARGALGLWEWECEVPVEADDQVGQLSLLEAP